MTFLIYGIQIGSFQGKLTGLADTLKSLKSDDPSKPRERLALGAHGEVLSLSTNGRHISSLYRVVVIEE